MPFQPKEAILCGFLCYAYHHTSENVFSHHHFSLAYTYATFWLVFMCGGMRETEHTCQEVKAAKCLTFILRSGFHCPMLAWASMLQSLPRAIIYCISKRHWKEQLKNKNRRCPQTLRYWTKFFNVNSYLSFFEKFKQPLTSVE